MGGGEAHTDDDPAATQLDNVLTSAAVARGAGEGGIGVAAFCIRPMATAATVLDGLLRAGATRSAYVTRGIGAPETGGFEWQPTQRVRSSCCTSQKEVEGPPSARLPPTPAPPAPDEGREPASIPGPASPPLPAPPAPVVLVPPPGEGEVHTTGDPAAIQLDNVPTSAAVAGAAGEGGIGLTGSCMRSKAISATVFDGLLRAGARRSV